MMTEEEIRLNIRARKSAEDLLAMIPDFIGNGTNLNVERFFEIIQQRLAEERDRLLGKPADESRQMSHAEAVEFEKRKLTRGKQKGKRVGELSPLHWLHWYESRWCKQLLRYMRSHRFRLRVSQLREEEL